MKGFEQFAKQQEACWIIDPLDGTTNFLAGLDYFAVCIALYVQGELLLGVVYRPQTEETFFAYRGGGAWKRRAGGKRRRLLGPGRKKLTDAVLATGFSSEKGRLINQEFRIFKKMMNSCRGIRRMGSAALDMCYLAEGQFSGFWERGLAPWDIAAAGVICQEARVLLSSWEGEQFTPFIETIMGAEPRIIKEFRQILLQS
jgi:myo-inositol-1(or 4)-monophosphatase